jgi:hypothetical protein
MASWEKELDWDTFHATLGRSKVAAPVAEVPALASEVE